MTTEQTEENLKIMAGISNKEEIIVNDKPPKIIKRNEFSLIEGLNYIFDESGRIDWRKMVNNKYLVVNRQNFTKRNQPIPESIEGLQDSDLLILLQGIKELASIRGFSDVSYKIITSTYDFCSAICTIKWIPSYEEEGREITFSSCADANVNTADGIFRNYLTTLAENRAFVRCVKSFLRINILGRDEISLKNVTGTESEEPQSIQFQNYQRLKDIMKEKDVSWDRVKKQLVKDKVINLDTGKEAKDFEKIEDVPMATVFHFIERIRNLKKKENEM